MEVREARARLLADLPKCLDLSCGPSQPSIGATLRNRGCRAIAGPRVVSRQGLQPSGGAAYAAALPLPIMQLVGGAHGTSRLPQPRATTSCKSAEAHGWFVSPALSDLVPCAQEDEKIVEQEEIDADAVEEGVPGLGQRDGMRAPAARRASGLHCASARALQRARSCTSAQGHVCEGNVRSVAPWQTIPEAKNRLHVAGPSCVRWGN